MKILSVSGATQDGKAVMSGVGTMCSTHGVPLELVLSFFKTHEFDGKTDHMVVDWMDYIQTCLNDGHNPRTIRARIQSAAGDVYGRVYSEELMTRVDKTLDLLNKPRTQT